MSYELRDEYSFITLLAKSSKLEAKS